MMDFSCSVSYTSSSVQVTCFRFIGSIDVMRETLNLQLNRSLARPVAYVFITGPIEKKSEAVATYFRLNEFVVESNFS